MSEAWGRNNLIRRFHWHFRGKLPPRLTEFGRHVVQVCRDFQPTLLLATGIAALSADCLGKVAEMGARRANYLTDDPWNKANGASFFWQALRQYDFVFSPREANLEDLRSWGCPRVEYLPFAYDPLTHFPEANVSDEELEEFRCDVAFLGCADRDRLPLARAIIGAGLKLRLYAGSWDRYSEFRRYWGGFVYERRLRLAVAGAALHLCLGRKANRDGHAMRSYELPAMGGPMLVERTARTRKAVRHGRRVRLLLRRFPRLARKGASIAT